jgi:hypothetical protein
MVDMYECDTKQVATGYVRIMMLLPFIRCCPCPEGPVVPHGEMRWWLLVPRCERAEVFLGQSFCG